MARSSEPLLAWLREMMDKRGTSMSSLAGVTGLERKRVKKLLAGTEAMTVDELLQISEALEVSPADFGLATPKSAAPEPQVKAPPGVVVFEALDVDRAALLCQAGFGVGCDFMFVCDTAQLADSGVPESVLRQYRGKDLPVKLEAVYHQYNEPEWTPRELTVMLSFDALYRCTIPFSAMKIMYFWPLPIPEPEPIKKEEPKKGTPFLRLLD